MDGSYLLAKVAKVVKLVVEMPFPKGLVCMAKPAILGQEVPTHRSCSWLVTFLKLSLDDKRCMLDGVTGGAASQAAKGRATLSEILDHLILQRVALVLLANT